MDRKNYIFIKEYIPYRFYSNINWKYPPESWYSRKGFKDLFEVLHFFFLFNSRKVEYLSSIIVNLPLVFILSHSKNFKSSKKVELPGEPRLNLKNVIFVNSNWYILYNCKLNSTLGVQKHFRWYHIIVGDIQGWVTDKFV